MCNRLNAHAFCSLCVSVCINLFSHLLAHKIRIKLILPQFMWWRDVRSARAQSLFSRTSICAHTTANIQQNPIPMICDYEINFQHVYRYKTVSVRKITSNILLLLHTRHNGEIRRDMEKGGGERATHCASEKQWLVFRKIFSFSMAVTCFSFSFGLFCCSCFHCSLIYSKRAENVFLWISWQANKTMDSIELCFGKKQIERKKLERNGVIYEKSRQRKPVINAMHICGASKTNSHSTHGTSSNSSTLK